jgi:hypothetical protein
VSSPALRVGRAQALVRPASPRQRCDLAHLAADAVERFDDVSAATGTTLLLEASPVVGVWDRVRVDQVLTNLQRDEVRTR